MKIEASRPFLFGGFQFRLTLDIPDDKPLNNPSGARDWLDQVQAILTEDRLLDTTDGDRK